MSQDGPTAPIPTVAKEANNDHQISNPEHGGDSDEKHEFPEMGTIQRRLVVFALSLTLFLSALDITIVSTALPTIAETLGATAAQYAWVGSSYTLASTSASPIWAKSSDILGLKIVLMAANATFMVGSVVAALSQSIEMLIGGRVIQGLGGGGIMVLVTIAIGDLFPLKDRAKYYGMTGLVYAISSSVGPLLGGVFTEQTGWRWCFWINLPFEGAALVVSFFVLEVPKKQVDFWPTLRSLDWVGMATIVGGALCFLYGLESGAGGLDSWGSATVVSLLVVGIAILTFFCVWESKFAANPLIPSRIFTSFTNAAAFGAQCLHSFVFISFDYFLPLYFQVALHFTPIMSGVTLLALVVPLSCMTVLCGQYISHTGGYLLPIRAGAVVMTLGAGLFTSFDATTNWAKIIMFLIIAGVGAGPLFQGPMIALQSHLQPRDISPAMSAVSFSRTLFSSISIVIGSVLLQRTLGGATLTMPTSSNADSTDNTTDTSQATKVDYMYALRIMWAFYTAICGILLLMSLAIKGKDLKSTPATSAIVENEEGKGEQASPKDISQIS